MWVHTKPVVDLHTCCCTKQLRGIAHQAVHYLLRFNRIRSRHHTLQTSNPRCWRKQIVRFVRASSSRQSVLVGNDAGFAAMDIKESGVCTRGYCPQPISPSITVSALWGRHIAQSTQKPTCLRTTVSRCGPYKRGSWSDYFICTQKS